MVGNGKASQVSGGAGGCKVILCLVVVRKIWADAIRGYKIVAGSLNAA